ncbi:hypothetical protein WG904_11110 [Pedobacter sp. Du54]|uniref:hypothetical protein n=1 Tax=Pedobacter anseongensis TaxID=3133439 RepID=UPI0030AB931D
MHNTNLSPQRSLTAGKHNKDTENRAIFKALIQEERPLSRRELSDITGFEIATLCRALFNLTNVGSTLKITSIKPCNTTGRMVYHYYFNVSPKQ